MYSMNSFTTSAIPLNCESGRDLPKRVTLGGDIFPMSNLGSASVEGDPLLPFLFKLMFSSALRDEIGVFKPVSLLFMVRRALEGLCDMTLVLTAFPLFFFSATVKNTRATRSVWVSLISMKASIPSKSKSSGLLYYSPGRIFSMVKKT